MVAEPRRHEVFKAFELAGAASEKLARSRGIADKMAGCLFVSLT